jgi:hypothetical protein
VNAAISAENSLAVGKEMAINTLAGFSCSDDAAFVDADDHIGRIEIAARLSRGTLRPGHAPIYTGYQQRYCAGIVVFMMGVITPFT